jgi:hypothetical protein
MPNWNDNELVITGPANKLKAFVDFVRGKSPTYIEKKESPNFTEKEANESILQFNTTVPVPDNILAQGYSEAGYQWQVEHWGTKWDVFDIDFSPHYTKGKVIYRFSTAWSPPIPWLEKTAPLFPKLSFRLKYMEPGMAFGGIYEKHGDEVVTNEYYQGYQFQEWLEKTDPSSYDAYFGDCGDE